MTRPARRGPWLPEEDQALLQLVRGQGPNNWVRISQQLQHRSPKQCRERYHQNLKPSLKHDPISNREGEMIEQMVAEMGKRWAEIARRLGNRSDNAVKNWWNGSMNRRKRIPTQASAGFRQVSSRTEPLSYPSHPVVSPGHYLPTYESSYGQTQSDQWLQRSDYRSTTTHAPSPIHVQESRVQTASPSYPYEHRAQPQQRPSFSTSASSELRPELPPLRPMNYISTDRRGSAFDRPLISPALSEVSQTASLRQPPSLVSDNQSTYSISPKTVTSPRPAMPTTFEAPRESWSSVSISQLPALQLPLGGPHNASSLRKPTGTYVTEVKPKDARMNVSSLLE